MRGLLALLGLLLGLSVPVGAQENFVSYLLSRTNNLRQANGLPAYALHPALTAAAQNHASWMAKTSLIQHTQFDGTGPRTRAPNAGFPSNWVSENIYLGSSVGPADAWNWWLGSPVHYAGFVSPYYDKVGIARATGATRTAYVMVFGNSTGRLLQATAGGAAGNAGAAPVQPAYVLGHDEYGNIKHEIQSGQTLGDIALIYGYVWDDIQYMLELNGMTAQDRLLLQPGSVFLVPPHDGTYTPVPAAPTETMTPPPAITPTFAATSTPVAGQESATPAIRATATRAIRIGAGATPLVETFIRADGDGEPADFRELALLGAAIVLQMCILGGAALELMRRSR